MAEGGEALAACPSLAAAISSSSAAIWRSAAPSRALRETVDKGAESLTLLRGTVAINDRWRQLGRNGRAA